MSDQTVTEVNLAEVAGVTPYSEFIEINKENEIEGLITFDQLVLNFIQQHEETVAEYKKLREALDSMHYTSTITKISLEELQLKKDHINKLTGAIEAMALYKKHVDPNVTDKDFVFEE
jgi:predicted RNA-binding protein with RPS1 domain